MDWDSSLERLRTLIEGSNTLQDKWEALRFLAQQNLYFLCKGVLGYDPPAHPIGMSRDFHGPLCMALDVVQPPYARRLDLWPRGHLKTHICTIGKSIQDYLRDRNVRILLASASIDGATKNLRAIKYQFAANPILRWLFPECIPDMKGDKWAETEVCLPRDRNRPESTFKCIGVGGHITGWHFDIQRKDDLIDEKTDRSPEEMEKIIDWHLLTINLFDAASLGVDHLIGTRWNMGDLYGYIIAHQKEYTVSTISQLHVDPEDQARMYLCWPERDTIEAVLRLREVDPYKFATQRQNNPRDEAIVEFSAHWLRYYAFANQNFDPMLESDEVAA